MDTDGSAARHLIPARPLLTLPLFAVAAITAIGGVAEAVNGRWIWAVVTIAGVSAWVSLALAHVRSAIEIDRSAVEGAVIRFRTPALDGAVPVADVTRVVTARSARCCLDVGVAGPTGPVTGVGRSLSRTAALKLVDALNAELGLAPATPAGPPAAAEVPVGDATTDQDLVGVPA